jgi:hypothetical protein
MDYTTSTYTVFNAITGRRREIRICENGFKFPGDHILAINDELINKWRAELCGR